MSTEQPDRIRVAVVFGGRSSEHGISCVTAGSVLSVLDRDRYDVIPVGITRDGRWVLAPDDPAQLAITGGNLPEVADAGGTVVLPIDRSPELTVAAPGDVPRELGRVDVVLPLLHGPYGEDGTLQGLLELAGARYVGSGVLASALGMDKHYMKVVLADAGVPVCQHALVTAGPWEAQRDRVLAEVDKLGWPVFVKPARAGSSMGISKVSDPAGLEDAVLAAREHDPKVLVEEAVAGREVECAVLASETDGPPEASTVGEIVIGGDHDFYDFEAKYLDEAHVGLSIPADLPDAAAQQLREYAVRAFEALSCEGLARADFFYGPGGEIVLNEVNTLPGFTPTSMFPQLWAASGLDYAALVDRLITTALNRPLGLR